MIAEADLYYKQLVDIFDSAAIPLSDTKPSAWTEHNLVMGEPFPGPYRYSRTPYVREIIDRLAPDDPARWIAVMKGLQIGVSAGVIIPGICYIIKEAPGNTYFTVGAPDLINKSVEKLDLAIDGANLRGHLKPQVQRVRNQKSGDTNTKKDFLGGFINITTPNNHKEWRDVSLKYGFIDDFEAAKSRSKESGSTRKLIEGRFTAYADTHKIFYISTPELKATSNIEPAYLLGDQRKYLIPCPCCGAHIELLWEVEVEKKKVGGITWEVDGAGKLIPGSVGYVCQECGGFFDDKEKSTWLLERGHGGDAYWQPTAEPSKPGYFSYHISSLYAPLGMKDWTGYVYDWIEAHPPGQERNEDLYKTFVTTVLGQTYVPAKASPKSTAIMKNMRGYDICSIPESMSIKDGNGKIVLLTLSADMNGIMEEHREDVRLDYEITAWAESGSVYSIAHGSIGTFVRGEKPEDRADRLPWTYAFNKERSVWPELEKILAQQFPTDTGRSMPILYAGLDCGHFADEYAYPYLDKTNYNVVGLRGDKEDKNIAYGVDVKLFAPAKSRDNLYILQVGLFKDKLHAYMGLKWSKEDGDQPANFMNFPEASGGLYQYDSYFEHYEGEHKIEVHNTEGNATSYRWVKKASTSKNHFWDCFDHATEVLTSDGWKFFAELTDVDLVATVNLDSNNLEYQLPQALIAKEHTGAMVLIDGKRVNACVTEDHRMVVYRKKFNAATNSGRMSEAPEIVLARDLRVTDTIKVACDWKSVGDEYFKIPALIDSMGRVTAEEKNIPAGVWAAFIGIYVAEGSKARNYSKKRGSWAHRVCIHQNKGVKFDQIEAILKQMPFTYNAYKSRGNNYVFVITQKQLYNAVSNLGANCYTKRSGDWIKAQSKETIAEFLRMAMVGDGYQNPKFGHRKYYTTSKLLADDIQELFIKIGAQANISVKKTPPCLLNGSGVSNLQYHISENKSGKASIRKADNTPVFKKVPYSGMVYCATVPNGTLICRREGKSFIAGNCRIYNMALREIVVDQVGRAMGLTAQELKVFSWADCAHVLKGG